MPYTRFKTAIGVCGIAWNNTSVTRFWLPAPDGSADRSSPPSDESKASEPLPEWVQQLIDAVKRHLEGDMRDFADVSFDFDQVSSFQRAVYEAALTVKSGTTRSYGWLASSIGQPPAASRAVGTALGQNPWPLLVPCHRFIAADGKMTGFSGPGGIKTKLRLLALEGAELFAE
jgi:methylated-DNA-[protein]-cysteine S-methyltransferase